MNVFLAKACEGGGLNSSLWYLLELKLHFAAQKLQATDNLLGFGPR